MYKLCSFLVFGLLFLSGCSSTALKSKDKTALKGVSVDEFVEIKSSMQYFGPGQSAGSAFGLIGAAIAHASTQGTRDKYVAISKDLDFDKTLRSTFVSEFQKRNILPYKAKDGNGNISLTLKGWAFTVPHGFSKQLFPSLSIDAVMTNDSGKVIWKKNVTSHPGRSGAVAGSNGKQLLNPEFMKSQLKAEAKFVVNRLLDHLEGKK